MVKPTETGNYREYIDSEISFLEVKRKNNKGKTIKKRIPVNAIQEILEGDHQSFVDEVIGERQQYLNTEINFNG